MRLVRILIGLAVVLVLLVEGATLMGVVDTEFLGDGTPTGENETVTPTETVDRASVGEDILPETAQREELTEATLDDTGDAWVYTMTVDVENTGDEDYRFELGTVTTSDDERVDASESVVVPPGETRTVSGRWVLPEGSFANSVEVTTTVGDGEPVEHEVLLDRTPVSRS